MSKRILVVDDHDVVRKGVRLLLQSHTEWLVVGEAEDGFDAIEKIQKTDPDLIILDLSMPRKDGLEVLAELKQMQVRALVLVLTMHDSKELSHALQKAGASGYVIKTQVARDLAPAIHNMFKGGIFFPSSGQVPPDAIKPATTA
jgi:two-component system, NarL family, response regulator NreC